MVEITFYVIELHHSNKQLLLIVVSQWDTLTIVM